jgi:hypothetical protein
MLPPAPRAKQSFMCEPCFRAFCRLLKENFKLIYRQDLVGEDEKRAIRQALALHQNQTGAEINPQFLQTCADFTTLQSWRKSDE